MTATLSVAGLTAAGALQVATSIDLRGHVHARVRAPQSDGVLQKGYHHQEDVRQAIPEEDTAVVGLEVILFAPVVLGPGLCHGLVHGHRIRVIPAILEAGVVLALLAKEGEAAAVMISEIAGQGHQHHDDESTDIIILSAQ